MAIKLDDESYKIPKEGCKVDKLPNDESKYTTENACVVLCATINTPIKKEQDKQAISLIQYGVVFFPEVIRVKAEIKNYSTVATLSSTPEAAIVKFMDQVKQRGKCV